MVPDRLDRKALLKQRGLTLTRLADELGVSKSHLSRVVSGERQSHRIAKVISRAIGLRLHEAFPEWYGERAA